MYKFVLSDDVHDYAIFGDGSATIQSAYNINSKKSPVKNINDNIIYKDGGTTTYSALTYKVIIWHRISPEETYEDTDFYIFPFNFHKLDWYWSNKTKNDV